jgi:hypothetical protein
MKNRRQDQEACDDKRDPEQGSEWNQPHNPRWTISRRRHSELPMCWRLRTGVWCPCGACSCHPAPRVKTVRARGPGSCPRWPPGYRFRLLAQVDGAAEQTAGIHAIQAWTRPSARAVFGQLAPAGTAWRMRAADPVQRGSAPRCAPTLASLHGAKPDQAQPEPAATNAFGGCDRMARGC